MNHEALENLLDLLKIDSKSLAARLGGTSEHYERLRTMEHIPFPVWDALQRFAYREGFSWDDKTRNWQRTQTPASAT